jgi:hypothetical protein
MFHRGAKLQPRHLAFERLVATQPNLHLRKENNQQLLVAYLGIRSSFQALGKWIGDEVKLTRKSLRQPLLLVEDVQQLTGMATNPFWGAGCSSVSRIIRHSYPIDSGPQFRLYQSNRLGQ